MKVLLVENHGDTATYLRLYLEGFKHVVTTVSTVAGARDLLDSGQFEFLICDISLPDGVGWELMAERPKDTIFAVAMSGFGSPGDQRRSLEAGFRYHLTKPFVPTEFEAILAEAERSVSLPNG